VALMGEPSLMEGESADTALGGTLGIIQPVKGYRFSIDPLLLADFASRGGNARQAVDLGCGSGVAGLALLHLGAANRLTGIDIQPEAVDRAIRSANWNGYGSRTKFLIGDIRDIEPVEADLVIANPPYMPLGRGRLNSDKSVAISRHEITLTVEKCCSFACASLTVGGRFCIVFPANQEKRLIGAIEYAGLNLSRFRRVYGREGEEPFLLLGEGLKGEGGEAIEEAPLILHPLLSATGEKYTKETMAILGAPRNVLS